MLLLLILVIPTNYAAIGPGGLTNLEDSFEIDGYEMDNHFYSIHVYSQSPITIFQYWLLKNNDNFEISEMTQRQEDTTITESYVQGSISKEVSYKTSIIKAYQLANEVNNDITIDYLYHGLIIYDYPNRISEMAIGDVITQINGIDISIYDFIDSKDLAYQSDVIFTISKEDGSSYEYHYEYQEDDVYFWFFPDYEITQANPSYDYESFSTIGGSSGGLMQTLSIYVSLLKLNITNIKIAGTGTIEMDGSIGLIGGIREKIITASNENVDVFFIPTAHLEDITDLEFTYILVPVDTVEEAVYWLYENVIR